MQRSVLVHRPVLLVAAGAAALALAATGYAASTARATPVRVTVSGLVPGALLDARQAAALHPVVHVSGLAPSKLAVSLDGAAVTGTVSGPGALTVPLPRLPDGPHTLAVHGQQIGFQVDATPPVITASVPAGPVSISSAVTVRGTVDQAGDRVSAPGGTVVVQGRSFTVSYPVPPSGAAITVTDRAGNTAVRTVTVPTRYPTDIRAVHMTGAAWSYLPLRNPILAMIKQHKINAVELDIKDEDGIVNFDPQLPAVTAAGAVFRYYDARAVTRLLHGMGVRVIGREVTFNDTKFADWAWAHGHRDWVIQTPAGSPYSYGYARAHFANFASPQVQAYEISVAKAAVQAGFDDVIFDYIRRPDGPISGERFPGLPVGAGTEKAAERAIAGFAQRARDTLRPLGAAVGAAIFAQAATYPQDTAQNVPMMARYLDVVVPMDYPSHWFHGEYNVPDPYADPYAIVQRSLKDWLTAVRGTRCVVVPWLQDEDFRGHYGPDKVLAEIKGSRDDGIPGWLMWSAGATYTPAAFTNDAPRVYTPRG